MSRAGAAARPTTRTPGCNTTPGDNGRVCWRSGSNDGSSARLATTAPSRSTSVRIARPRPCICGDEAIAVSGNSMRWVHVVSTGYPVAPGGISISEVPSVTIPAVASVTSLCAVFALLDQPVRDDVCSSSLRQNARSRCGSRARAANKPTTRAPYSTWTTGPHSAALRCAVALATESRRTRWTPARCCRRRLDFGARASTAAADRAGCWGAPGSRCRRTSRRRGW